MKLKSNMIRPLLILAFVVGSFPLHSADYVPVTERELASQDNIKKKKVNKEETVSPLKQTKKL